ncbi:hypothetical protein SAMN05660284_00800 [Formivibrio citricus]|uniref:Lipoprotein n=1 Tax=Formivibrio citricus TaxID=83765 RepID=A0A1I4WZH5_9NEIS|nr:hypothetical protein [Formivibrio citricus]SFN18633.1 hypothetical protein SAMN05660284_00800 [Formivibrio citricus]
MRNLSIKLILAGLGICAALAGCASSTPVLDSKFGDAVTAAKAQQTLHPDAPLNKKAATGLDGKGADTVVDKYHKSFETQQPATNTFTIGIGSGSSGSTTSK